MPAFAVGTGRQRDGRRRPLWRRLLYGGCHLTTLPTRTLYVISIGPPLLAFLGVVVGHVLFRKGATRLDVWRRREETMRMLRWASEQAASAEPAKVRMGYRPWTP